MNAANGTPVPQATCGLGPHLNGLSEDNRSECPCHLFHLQIHFFFKSETRHISQTLNKPFFPFICAIHVKKKNVI